MGNRGTEGLHKLRKDSFTLKTNEQGTEYLELNYNPSTKKSQGDDNREMLENAILLAQPGSKRCPVNSFKLYLSTLTDLDDLFQQPNPYFKNLSNYWYKAPPVGEGTITKFMQTTSQNAGLNYKYTNKCIRGTTTTGMQRQGHALQDIANVTKHKNLQSLKHYLDTPTLKDKEQYAKSLFDYGKADSDLND